MRATGALNGARVNILFDTGATVSLVSQTLVSGQDWARFTFPISPQKIIIGDGTEYIVKRVLKAVLKIGDLEFELVAWIVPMSRNLDVVLGMQTFTELEANIDIAAMEIACLLYTSPSPRDA